MKIEILSLLLAVGLVAGCKKEPDNKPDYSQTIFEADPSWERVGIVPWQESDENVNGGRYIVGDLQFSPSGQLLFAYNQRSEESFLNNTASTAYLATVTPGTDQVASVASAGFTIKASDDAPLFFQQPSEGKVFACIASPGRITIRRSDSLAPVSMGLDLGDYMAQRFTHADLGPRYLPRYHPGSGDLLFNNDRFGIFYSTEVYNTGTNSWLEANNPATSRAGEDWVSYQTSDGVIGYCELQIIRDSVYLSIYQLDKATRNFDSVFARLLPEFSGNGTAYNCGILSYNDEDGLVVAVARYSDKKPLEASVYKKENGSPQFQALYQSVALPAVSTASHLQSWGYREQFIGGASACTPDGTLYDLMEDQSHYYLITVDAAGTHEKARFTSNGRGKLFRWPLAFVKGSFYLLAGNANLSITEEDRRLEIMRVR